MAKLTSEQIYGMGVKWVKDNTYTYKGKTYNSYNDMYKAVEKDYNAQQKSSNNQPDNKSSSGKSVTNTTTKSNSPYTAKATMPNIPLVQKPNNAGQSDPIQVAILEQKVKKEQNESYRKNTVNALQEGGVSGASNVMTESEWRKRKGKDGGTYKDYLNSQMDRVPQLSKEEQAYVKYAVDKKSDVEGINNEQKLLGGNTAQYVAAPKKSAWDKLKDNVSNWFGDTFSGTMADKWYQESTGYKDNKAAWTDDQLATLAVDALHRADQGDTRDFAIVDQAYARLSRSSKYKDSDLVLALKEAQKSWGASPLTAAGKNVKAAFYGIGADFASFTDSIGADHIPGLNSLNDAVIKAGKQAREDAATYNKGMYGETLGTFTQGVVNLVPYFALGSGKAATTTLSKAPQYATYIKTIAQNPSFWYSLTTMWGQKYQEALDGGATKTDARNNAILYSVPAALVEVAGGIGSPEGSKKLSSTILEEIGEEIAQDIISGASDKATTNPDLPVLSFTEDAIVNPVNMLKTAITTAPIVAVAGGANVGINKIANLTNQRIQMRKITNEKKVIDSVTKFTNDAYSKMSSEDADISKLSPSNSELKKIGELYSEESTIKTLIQEGLESPEGTTSRTLANELNKKVKANEEISGQEIGNLVVANIKQIVSEQVTEEKAKTDTRESSIKENTNAPVNPAIFTGDVFKDAKTGNTFTVVNRGDAKTTVEIETPKGTVTREFGNERIDTIVESGQIEKIGITPTKNTSVNVGDVFESNGKTYTVTGKDRGITTFTIKDESGNVTTDELLDTTVNYIFSQDGFAKVQGGVKPSANNVGVASADSKISSVVGAMNDTFEPGALEVIYGSMPSSVDKSLDVFANKLIEAYKKHGNIGHISKYFKDGGKSVIAAIEGKVDTTKVESKAKSTKGKPTVSKTEKVEAESLGKSAETETDSPNKLSNAEEVSKETEKAKPKDKKPSSTEPSKKTKLDNDLDNKKKTSGKKASAKDTKANTLDNDIDDVIKLGTGTAGGKQRIIDFYKENPSKAEAVEFLKKEYGIGGRSYTFSNGARGWTNHNAKGIELDIRDGDKKVYSWSEVDNRIRKLVENGEYSEDKKRYSLSSMGATFFGNEDITADEFQAMLEDGSYKEHQGYKDYLKNVTNVYAQSRGITKLSDVNVAEIKRQIEGIINVAIAAKKAGYDIYDDGRRRTRTDSKERLLFSSLEPNSDYVTSSDISTICDKRTNFSEIYDEIVRLEEERGVPANKRFFKNVDNYFILHKIMADKGLTIPCEECYVESMRKNLGSMAQAFIDLVTESDENNKTNEQLYHQKGKEKGKLKTNNATRRTMVRELLAESETISVDDLTVEMLTTAKGLTKLRLDAPLVYEQFNAFYGQAKPKLTREATPFRPGELTALLTKSDGTIDTALVKEIVSTGGFRLQSYSDFQIKNYVDVLQTIFEASMLGLNGHAYTKVPAFLEATNGTNLKRNISIFMYDDNGKWVLDKKNSFPMELDDIYALVASDDSGNTSIIAVSQNADMSAWIMANDNVGYGIPFHKSGLKMEVVRARSVKTADGREVLGYANEIDHTKQQSEVYKKTVGAKEKANTKAKKPIDIYSFWDFENKDNLSQKELIEKNVKKYIDECEKRNYRPKFRAYVMNNGKLLNKILEYSKELGNVSQSATVDDISFKYGEYTIPYGYYKFLGDFGMFKPDGTASPIEALSLENYDFDKAIDFFKDSEKLHTNELLQQFENGEVRERYREMVNNGELTAEQLESILKEKRSEIAQSVVDGNQRYSVAEGSYVPTFYSHMGNVIADIKQEKLGANSVVSYLKGKGVKNEEIKWSGIEEFLEGKKSVTKAELQEFVEGSMLQIEEVTLDNNEIPYTQEQTEQIAEYESQRNEIFEELKVEWKKNLGTDYPSQTFGNGLESSVVDLLIIEDRQIKESTEAGKEMVEARQQLVDLFEGNDFGFDSEREALVYAVRNPQDFLDSYELTEEEQAVLERFINAKENIKNVEGVPVATQRHLKDIAARADAISRKISKIKTEHYAENEKHLPKWKQYTLDGGKNYREIAFTIPDSTYSNSAMAGHWGGSVVDGRGVLAHARVQDFEVDGKKMLFIEEIQSDWHNDGHRRGYQSKLSPSERNSIRELRERQTTLFNELKDVLNEISTTSDEEVASSLLEKANKIRDEERTVAEKVKKLDESGDVPDAPFRDNYHEYVLKRLIRMAAEQGYDSIGWTPADIQSNRWSSDYAEGYRIEYDQDIPKFLNKYGKKWGAKVGRTPMEIDGETETTYYVDDRGNKSRSYNDLIDKILSRHGIDEANFNDYQAAFVDDETVKILNPKDESYFDEEIHIVTEPTSVWSMDITDSMKDSVLYEGQALYSLEREANNNEQIRNDSVLGNSRRGNNGSTREQTERISYFKQKNQGKTRAERKSFAKELLEQGQAEEVVDGKYNYTIVKSEAYNDDMKSMVEDAKNIGVELGFFVGNGKVRFDGKRDFKVNGIKYSDNRVLVQYDSFVSPQVLAKHEIGHAKWENSEWKTIKDTILNSLSESEKEVILSQQRFRDYMELYKGDEDIVWEEFVVDVMSGMNDYTTKYIDTVVDYWYGNESAEGYSPATYAESIDTGGKTASDSTRLKLSESGETNGYEQNDNSEELGQLQNSSKAERLNRVGEMGHSQSQKPNTPHTKSVHRNGVSAETRTPSGLTAEQAALKEQNKTEKMDTEFYIKAKVDGVAQSDVFVAENTVYYPDSAFERNDISIKNGVASFTEKRFADLIEEYSVPVGGELNRDYAKAYVAYISPSEFLSLTTVNEDAIVRDSEKHGKLDTEILKNNSVRQGPFLELDFEDGMVMEHNGRHRMVMLRGAGVEKVAIVIRDIDSERNKYKTRKMTNVSVTGQEFHTGTAPGKVTLNEIIPLSPNYRNEVREKFVDNEADVKYSLATDGVLDLEDLWNDAIETYGAIPKGEIPARDIDVPKQISPDKVVSQFARTMLEAGVTPDEVVSDFEKAILDGTMTHEVITDKQSRQKAVDRIKRDGFKEALNDWNTYAKDGAISKEHFALGLELYNQCITNKDVTNAMKLAAELVAESSRAGQTLQAARMLKRMTPDGQLYYLEKSVQNMNEDFKNKLGDKFKDIELDENLMEEFLNEKDEVKRNEVYDKICQNIADQTPATFRDKWNSWRYLAMLGNPRTHIRNILGNAVFVPAIRAKNYIGTVIERVLRVPVAERTKSLHKNKQAVQFAKNDFGEMVKVLQGENAKYAVTNDIESKRTIFKTKPLEWLRLKNFDFLEKEDMWFLKMHYVDALARLITARKIDVKSIDAKTLGKIRAIAVKEAQAATYRDANSIAEGLNVLQRKLEQSKSKPLKATGVLIEGVMPFKKTPMNIAKQGINYSPLGILKGVYKALANLRNGNATATEVIDDLSKGLTGTGTMLLGLLLANLGVLVGAGDKPDKEKKFDEMVGEQDYALKIDDWSFTIDWATPSNLSLFIGAELYDLTKDEFKFADIVSAVSTITEPLLELSVFSGLNGVIESAQYSENSPVVAIASDMTTSYFMQALPTVGGQISRVLDEQKREYYYADKNKDVPRGLQQLIGQASSKIPFASKLFEPAIDEWGREETYGSPLERVAENTVLPGYYAKENYTKVDEVIKDLYEKTGETSVLPISQQKYYEENYVRYDMTAEEYTEARKMRGQKSFEYVQELIANKTSVKLKNKVTGKYETLKFSAMSDDEKVRAIKKCYEDAGDEVKEIMLEKIKVRKANK